MPTYVHIAGILKPISTQRTHAQFTGHRSYNRGTMNNRNGPKSNGYETGRKLITMGTIYEDTKHGSSPAAH